MKHTNPKGCKIKKCSKCKIVLIKQTKPFICSKCSCKQNKDWISKHRSSYNRHEREKGRKFVIQEQDGTILRGNKRTYPKDSKCEICGSIKKRLAYHHWNDKEISKGIWCCLFECHGLAEAIDKDNSLPNKYELLKRKING